MADLPPNVTPAATATSQPTILQTASVPAPIMTGIVSVPDTLTQLTRQIDLTATLTAQPTGNLVTVATPHGDIALSLGNLVGVAQQDVVKQLASLFDTQKPLSLIINPGNPPTQAFLFLPSVAGAVTTPPVPQPTNANLPPQPVGVPATAPGITLTATVLPNGMSSILSPGTAMTPPTLTLLTPLTLPTATSQTPVISYASAVAQPLPTIAAPAPSLSLPISSTVPLAASPQTPQLATLPGQPVSAVVPNMASSPATATPMAPGVAMQPAPQSVPTAAAPVAQPPAPFSTSALLQPGKDVALQIVTTLPASAPAPQLQPNQMIATVIGKGTDNQPIIQLGNTALFVKQPVDVPVGTQLVVTITADKSAQPLPLPLPDTQTTGSLPQVLAALNQASPQLMQQFMQTNLPQLNQAFPAALLFMMTAIKQGNTSEWLGKDVVQSLTNAGKLDLLAKLTRETGGAEPTAEDGVVGQWQSYPVPIYAHSQLQILNLYVHRDDGGNRNRESQATGSGLTRFIIDVNFSKLGAMQLDGLVQPQKLDMIVRSEHILPEGLAPDLRKSYTSAMSAVGFGGGLHFQVGRRNWLNFQTGHAGAAVTT